MSRGPYFSVGRYWGKVIGQAMGVTKNNNPQFVLTFQVQGKIDPADPEGALLPCEQYERSIFKVITDKTIDYVMEDLKALEFTGDSFAQLDPKTPGFCDFRDKELAFYCDHDEYEGQTREKWGIARDSAGLQVKPLEAQEMRKLDALFGKQLKAAKSKDVKAALPAMPSTVPPKRDPNQDFQEAVNAAAGAEDIPFGWLLPFALTAMTFGQSFI